MADNYFHVYFGTGSVRTKITIRKTPSNHTFYAGPIPNYFGETHIIPFEVLRKLTKGLP